MEVNLTVEQLLANKSHLVSYLQKTDGLVKVGQQVPAVFIWSISQSSGTTWLQRLISSSGETVVFGDNPWLTNVIPGFLGNITALDAENKLSLAKFKDGDLNFSCSNLQPRSEIYHAFLVGQFNSLMLHFQMSALELGYSNFGMKNQLTNMGAYQVVSQLMPKAKHIFVYQDIRGMLKAQKTEKVSLSPEVLKQTCLNYNLLVKGFKGLKNEAITLIKYEDLKGKTEQTCEKLKEFLSLEIMDSRLKEMDTSAGLSEELDSTEVATVEGLCGETLSELGYI